MDEITKIALQGIKRKKLSEVLLDLEEAVSETSLFFDGLDKSDLPRVLRAFDQLKGAKERLEASTESVKRIYDEYSYNVIPDLFEANGFESVKSHGKNFITNHRLDASIPREKRDAGFKWLREIAKVPELIQETVNPRSLSALVKQRLGETGEMPPEDAISVYQKRYISIRKG